MAKGKIKKAILITCLTIVSIVVVIIACISPIAKYLIEKNSVKYLGRVIKMQWLYLNPFTGYLHINHLKVYEANSDSLFLTADGLSAKYEIFKMLHKTYEISSITLDKPVGYIIQNRRRLNFSDIIERFTPKEKRDTTKPHNPVQFNILNISVTDGKFCYIAPRIPINYYVNHVNVQSTGKWWNVDSMIINFALQSGPGSGDIKGHGAINFDQLRYSLTANINNFDLKLMDQYLHDLANYGHVSAILDAQLKGNGSFIDGLDLDASGFIALSKFHLGKSADEDYAAFDRLVIDAENISPKNFKYYFDSITLVHPYFLYERYDELNNFERMFGKNGARIKQANAESEEGKFNLIIELAKYIKKLGVNFLHSYYKVDKLAIYNGDLKFNDYSLREKFAIEAAPIYIIADSIDRNNRRFTAALAAFIKPYGNLKVDLSLDPNNYGNFDLQYKLLKVPVSMFNPYVITYTSFPLDRGMLEFNGYMNVKDSSIKSENHLLIVDPRVGQRLKNKDTKWIPLPLIMSVVRSSGSAIDFQIPIAGNLSNPRFKFWGVIGDVVRNILVKPPSTAYIIHEKQVEQEVEKSLTLTWQMRQTELRPLQQKFVNRMADFLKTNSSAFITVSSLGYVEKEKENILLFEAKKKYFLQLHKIQAKNLSEADSINIAKMSVKDSLFIHYLDKVIGDSVMFTLQEKCNYLVGKELLAKSYNQLLKNRETIFKSYFGNAASRVKFNSAVSTTPFNGFSYYKIDYKDEIPKQLMKAYDEMEELNQEAPRKKYKANREAAAITLK
jgi:hypothetical protein